MVGRADHVESSGLLPAGSHVDRVPHCRVDLDASFADESLPKCFFGKLRGPFIRTIDVRHLMPNNRGKGVAIKITVVTVAGLLE